MSFAKFGESFKNLKLQKGDELHISGTIKFIKK